MVITGIVIVVATFIAIIKQFETRLVLLLSGLLMCFIGGQLGAGTTAFVKELTNPGLVPTICTVLGFSYVMEYRCAIDSCPHSFWSTSSDGWFCYLLRYMG